jgi:hypothetical protein
MFYLQNFEFTFSCPVPEEESILSSIEAIAPLSLGNMSKTENDSDHWDPMDIDDSMEVDEDMDVDEEVSQEPLSWEPYYAAVQKFDREHPNYSPQLDTTYRVWARPLNNDMNMTDRDVTMIDLPPMKRSKVRDVIMIDPPALEKTEDGDVIMTDPSRNTRRRRARRNRKPASLAALNAAPNTALQQFQFNTKEKKAKKNGKAKVSRRSRR